MKNKKSPIIIALDYINLNEALKLVDQINPKQCRLKIGPIMYTLFGPSLINMLHNRGFEIFLDLKLYDIPNTIEYTIAAAADLGIWMINIHASGGIRMMMAARKPLIRLGKDAPLVVAVTVLTSMNQKDLKYLGIKLTPKQQAKNLAILTHKCGLNGVVCSAHEAIYLKKKLVKIF